MIAAVAKNAQALGRAVATAGWRSAAPRAVLVAALEHEWAERRFFLWLPVAAGTGVALYFSADREPSLAVAFAITAVFVLLAVLARRSRRGLVCAAGLAAVAGGLSAATLRTALIDHPVIARTTIAKLTGTVEAVDHRRVGARFVVRIDPGGGTDLTRVRLTTRRDVHFAAGDGVSLTARLVPPAAALPGGFSFARDAYFGGLDAVGSVLGGIMVAPPAPASLGLRFRAAVDRARNALALRVGALLPGDTGAIAAAMVTGKRDLLSEDGRDLIREAGIFHIITIAGVQMTLVAGLLFAGFRAAFAAVPGLALRYPIKAWAAACAMVGAVAYDIGTGSRIGTERALIMTLILLGAVLLERRALTMRNLALAALAVVVLEPEAILGASFQLSFAAVAALVAVQESRFGLHRRGPSGKRATFADVGLAGLAVERIAAVFRHIGQMVFATVAASSATAPVMASHFHEISPYVVIGNPLTLAIIEFFAVPGALIGAVLYPLGLDRPVWHWVGWGIEIVLWAARLIASAPGSTVIVPAFAPWSLGCFGLAVASAVIWRSPILRLSALPLVALGLVGTTLGARYDLLVPPSGDTVAYRTGSGRLAVAGRLNGFGATQWLTADGDAREPGDAYDPDTSRCDRAACIVAFSNKTLSLVTRPEAFEEDCRRVDVVVTSLYAPASCGAELVIDRGTLAASGALAFTLRNDALVATPARGADEDRPWSPRPRPLPGRRVAPATPDDDGVDPAEP